MWIYRGQEFSLNQVDESFIGFVYLITNIQENKLYIGKKIFFNKKKRPPLKGKKRNRICLVESDWKTYYGSNEQLKQDVLKLGVDNFKREILHLCKNKTEMSYLETKEIFNHDCLLKESFYNSWVTCKITKSGLDGLR